MRDAGAMGSANGPRASKEPRPVVERIVLQAIVDPYLSLRGLAGYSGLSTRKLRMHLSDVRHPIPCYRVGRKILVRRSDFDAWMAAYRAARGIDLDRLVTEVLRDVMSPRAPTGNRPGA